jgi:hypothetical protein
VFIISNDGSWLGISAYIERIMQMSSAHSAHVRPQLAELQAGLAVLLELERRLHQVAGLALRLHRAAGQRLTVVLVEHRLGVEAVDVR